MLASPLVAGAAPAFGLSIVSLAEPSNFSFTDGCGCDRYSLTVTNTSSRTVTGPIVIRDQLPTSAALQVTSVQARNVQAENVDEVEEQGFTCDAAEAACTYESSLPPGDALQITLGVTVSEAVPTQTVENHATAEVHGAVIAETSEPTTMSNTVDGPTPAFGLQDFSFQAYAPDGAPDALAGDHPYAAVSTFDFHSTPDPNGSKLRPFEPVDPVKDVVIELPLGYASDALAAPQCPESSVKGRDWGSSDCPPASRIGNLALDFGGERTSSLEPEPLQSALYNVAPDAGYPAEFGANVFFQDMFLYGQVVPSPAGYRLRVLLPGILRDAALPLDGVSLSLFGDPGEHDEGGIPQAFLTNPTTCSTGPLTATIHVDSWTNPGEWTEDGRILHGPDGPGSQPLLSSPGWVGMESVSYPEIDECDALQFNPVVNVQPTTTQVDSPSGYGVDIQVPQAPNVWPDRATPGLKDATVTFPQAVSISPSAADGLEGCSEAQIAPLSSEPAACPQASQIGTATIETPLLPSPLTGEIFLRTPECEAASCEAAAEEGRMFGLFVQAEASGVNIKLKGQVEVGTGSPRSLASGLQPGQLRAKFTENPQLPVSDLHLQFDGGEHAPLVNPPTCGTATTTFQLTPWSVEVPEERFSSFGVDWNGEGGACPATEPFSPSFSSGLSYTNAAAFSPFTLEFSRQDREQDLSAITLHTPAGVGAMLAGVPRCEEPEAAGGSCPSASQIGRADVAIGAGSAPYWLPQRGQPENPVYLTGPYGGAPFGLAIVVHANAGPFDLGDVVVRAGISIAPQTSALTIATGPLPQIVDGIPLRMRTVSVDIDRPGFMFAPTDCSEQSVTATITSAQGTAANVSSPFDVGGCQDLPFMPKLTASTAGSGAFAGHGASLHVKISAPAEGAGSKSPEANLKSVHVQLPLSLPTRLSTLQGACISSHFASNPASCPASSVVGSATIHTLTLPVALHGPAYLVSHGGAAFPDLVLVLQGDGVAIELIGKTEIKGGFTYTHFDNLPDSPIESFELDLPEGPHSVLSATKNLCKPTKTTTVSRHLTVRTNGHVHRITRKVKEKIPAPLQMPTRLEAQNNAVLTQTTQVAITNCPKPKPQKKK